MRAPGGSRCRPLPSNSHSPEPVGDQRTCKPKKMNTASEWIARSGDVWAMRWQDTDRALSGLASPLHSAILDAMPPDARRVFEIGCGAGSTTKELASARPDLSIAACDLSAALIEVARERLQGIGNVDLFVGDAQAIACDEGPFDLIYSRHGVMFFPDPPAAFRMLRSAARDSASLVFSCFRSWGENAWASELASAAAGRPLPPPGREPSGFAFADPDYVRELLGGAGWADIECRPISFRYVAGEGAAAVDRAQSFLLDIGPASAVIRAMTEEEVAPAKDRMRSVIERHFNGETVEFEAAVWIWSARAGAA